MFIDVSVSKRREEALKCIVECTTPKADQTFFQSYTQAIANALQMRYALIGEVVVVDGDADPLTADQGVVGQAVSLDQRPILETVGPETMATGLVVKPLAFWRGDSFSPLKNYNVVDLPCGLVFKQEAIYRCERGVQQEFPEAKLLQDLKAESYVGIPIYEPSGSIMGHIALLDTQPMMGDVSLQNYVLKIFATRVGAEN